MIQNVCFDVLNFRPKKIKLFNLNFRLAQEAHHEGYKPDSKAHELYVKNSGITYHKLWPRQIVTTGGFAHHDLLSQLNFTRNLWRNKKVEVDDVCAEVLLMSNKEYLARMEKIYILPAMAGHGGRQYEI